LDGEQDREIEQVAALEKDFSGDITLGKKQFAFKARIDRIDRLADGSLLVLDYKTGVDELPSAVLSGQEMEWDRRLIREKIKSFQLPIYLYFAHNQYGGQIKINAALYSLRDSERIPAIKLFLKPGEDLTAGSGILKYYMDALDFVLNREILNPDIPFAPEEKDDSVCTYCNFSVMCK
jgi:hypothetical protein